ncbi:hypothetical protein HYC85_006214 [Camellia sinensis]|uniref:Tify domain-containing protein n=1 Tax=Camellia sinensis TaxID=4442 RepID=A0A7J7HMY0_CAMSI|nr:hypothetical protein HYC85_006214 [Camellia sinensis]
MSRSAVELDFSRMEKENSSKKFIDRRRSFRDIQSVISKLNPQLLKTVIASGSVDHTYNNVAKSSENCNLFLSSKSSSNASGSEPTPETTPLTIFYNGSVTVFDVPRHKSQTVESAADPKLALSSTDKTQILDTINRGHSFIHVYISLRDASCVINSYDMVLASKISAQGNYVMEGLLHER